MKFEAMTSKPARGAVVRELRAKLKTTRPNGAKTVGGGTVLVYFDDENLYLSDGQALRALLRKYQIEV